jgi:hypothetical protein
VCRHEGAAKTNIANADVMMFVQADAMLQQLLSKGF